MELGCVTWKCYPSIEEQNVRPGQDKEGGVDLQLSRPRSRGACAGCRLFDHEDIAGLNSLRIV